MNTALTNPPRDADAATPVAARAAENPPRAGARDADAARAIKAATALIGARPRLTADALVLSTAAKDDLGLADASDKPRLRRTAAKTPFVRARAAPNARAAIASSPEVCTIVPIGNIEPPEKVSMIVPSGTM